VSYEVFGYLYKWSLGYTVSFTYTLF
jgi:hypothetical protein